MTREQLRERCEEFADGWGLDDLADCAGVTFKSELESFALECIAQGRKAGLEECADIVANEGYASRSVRAMFYDPIQQLISDTDALAAAVKED